MRAFHNVKNSQLHVFKSAHVKRTVQGVALSVIRSIVNVKTTSQLMNNLIVKMISPKTLLTVMRNARGIIIVKWNVLLIMISRLKHVHAGMAV